MRTKEARYRETDSSRHCPLRPAGLHLLRRTHTGPAPLTPDALKNLAYPSEFPAGKTAKPIHRSFEEAIVSGSATKLRMNVGDNVALGDLT